MHVSAFPIQKPNAFKFDLAIKIGQGQPRIIILYEFCNPRFSDATNQVSRQQA